MTQEWGRAETAGTWPRPKPVWTFALVLVSLVVGGGVGAYRYTHIWTPLQRLFLSPYLRSEIASDLAFKTGHYRLLHVVGRQGSRLPLDEEVDAIPGTTEPAFALTDVGRAAGDLRLAWQDIMYSHAALHDLLQRWIYDGQTPTDLVWPALWWAFVVFGAGLLVAIPKDLARARERRHGRRLKGPELLTAARFNRRMRADGIGFAQTSRLPRRRWVRIPQQKESSHLLIMGDSGTGKSALIRQILCQLEARGDTAIVYDPALEYTPQFYTPERGDVILNPLDTRSPYWSPGDELRHDAEALTLATSLFPDRHNENPFFTEGPRRIFAHLLTFRPTAHQLADWLCDEDELDRRVRGTSYAAMIDRQAPAQRSGVLASLNMVADTLKLLPLESDTTARWSAAAWSRQRKGWLFLTSTPETRTRLVPLTSLWLDMLVLRLMHVGESRPRPVWFILDELASLQRLPQLHTAITENRKSNNPVVLGFQGRSQLETRYGHDAEAMLSQPATKVFLRTSEPRAAKWISETIGEIEIERLRESRSKGRGGQRSYGLERQVEPLVMASEISGLAALHGYLKLENLVTRLDVPFIELPHRHPAVIERPIPAPTTVNVPPFPSTDVDDARTHRLAPDPLTQTPDSANHGEAFFR
ncbi:MAG: type IV secretion system DNA-binding domain-containing protein [Vicinamibacterales bacterium]